jgi:hypothetical protein
MKKLDSFSDKINTLGEKTGDRKQKKVEKVRKVGNFLSCTESTESTPALLSAAPQRTICI